MEPVQTREIRINKAIALAGLASRREADRLIREGEVRVNGQVVTQPGRLLHPDRDRLEVSGRAVFWEKTPSRDVWALYKPRRVVSTLKDPQGRASLADWIPRSAGRIFPIGRLDYDSEGLILLTNDGDLAHLVAHPSFAVEKVYLVKVKGLIEPSALRILRQGPVFDGKKHSAMKTRVLHTHHDKTWLEVTLREGANHHIKKAFAGVDHRVLKIKRYRIGPVELGEMKAGELRKLCRSETDRLLSHPGR